jgi:large subunit ribosomal protein L9
MPQVEIVLTEDIKHLGKFGETKRVKRGYAKNFLIPEEKALYVTSHNMLRFEAIKKREMKRRAKERADFQAIADIVNGKSYEFIVKTHDEGKLYGSVSVSDVLKRIVDEQEVTVDRKHLGMDDHIRVVGEYKVPVVLYDEVAAEFTIVIKAQEEEKKVEKAEKQSKQRAEKKEKVEIVEKVEEEKQEQE